jgi:transposase InsO family protein
VTGRFDKLGSALLKDDRHGGTEEAMKRISRRRELTIDRPDNVWCTDITYIPMRRGFLYLIAVMDWESCKSLPRA